MIVHPAQAALLELFGDRDDIGAFCMGLCRAIAQGEVSDLRTLATLRAALAEEVGVSLDEREHAARSALSGAMALLDHALGVPKYTDEVLAIQTREFAAVLRELDQLSGLGRFKHQDAMQLTHALQHLWDIVNSPAWSAGARSGKGAYAGGGSNRTPQATVDEWQREDARLRKNNPKLSKRGRAKRIAVSHHGRFETIRKHLK